MTEPTGGPPPVPDPASAPPPAAPAAPAAAPAAAPSAWQAPAPVVAPAGPAPGLAYAGLGVRIGALIIDYILLLIVFLFVSIALGAIFLGTLISGGTAGACGATRVVGGVRTGSAVSPDDLD